MKFEEKIIVKSSVTVLYQPLMSIRKLVFDLEEKFKGKFQSPQLIPVPDEAPPEIPRIIFNSTYGHSTLNISPLRTELNTNYDDKYHSDLEKCFEYLANKSNSIEDLVSLAKIEPVGIALGLNLRFPVNEVGQQESVKILQSKFLPETLVNDDIEDFRFNQTIRISDMHYISNTFNNYRLYFSKVPITSPHTPLTNLELREYGLEINIEVNDKLGFNRGEPFKGISQLSDFITIIRTKISELEAFITK